MTLAEKCTQISDTKGAKRKEREDRKKRAQLEEEYMWTQIAIKNAAKHGERSYLAYTSEENLQAFYDFLKKDGFDPVASEKHVSWGDPIHAWKISW